MAGHMHFDTAGHAWDSETTVKHKVYGVNITNTNNLVPVRTPVPVPLA